MPIHHVPRMAKYLSSACQAATRRLAAAMVVMMVMMMMVAVVALQISFVNEYAERLAHFHNDHYDCFLFFSFFLVETIIIYCHYCALVIVAQINHAAASTAASAVTLPRNNWSKTASVHLCLLPWHLHMH